MRTSRSGRLTSIFRAAIPLLAAGACFAREDLGIRGDAGSQRGSANESGATIDAADGPAAPGDVAVADRMSSESGARDSAKAGDASEGGDTKLDAIATDRSLDEAKGGEGTEGGPISCKTTNDCPVGYSCSFAHGIKAGECTTTCSSTQPCNGGCCDVGIGFCVSGTDPALCGSSGDACASCVGLSGTACLGSTCGCNVDADCPGGGVCAFLANSCSPGITFLYTGAAQVFVVPTGMTAVTITAAGAAAVQGGLGGITWATIPVAPGETLTILVGSSSGFNGGGSGFVGLAGGGGASDVRQGGTALSDRVLVAGGGGGGGSLIAGGAGGATTGGDGGGPSPGGGGTQTAGGGGGKAGAADGILGIGGNGASGSGTGGGGGGGLYGGGGGGAGSGGGGGSSYVTSSATGVSIVQGKWNGDGQVTLSF